MKIGYLMNVYPTTSSTFIRREIEALERHGLEVKRFALRRWSETLVDERDRAEESRVEYILSGRSVALIIGLFKELILNPIGLMRALPTWVRLLKNAQGGFVRHVAYLLEAIALRRIAKENDLDHIHTHFSTNGPAVTMLCHRLGGPGYSFTAHGPDEFINWSRSSLSLKVSQASFVVAISHYCKVQLVLASDVKMWGKIHVVRCGLEPDEFKVSDAEFDVGAPFVCVGRLCPQKAQPLIVEAVAQVAQVQPNIRVQLIGDGPSRKDVEAAITRHGLENNIDMLGWQDNWEVKRYLGRARALLLPSFAEGLPVVIMESLALGRPVISTYIAGIPELVDQECGWIIPAGSSEHIAKAMIQALETDQEELVVMGQKGRSRVEQNHDIDKNAKLLETLFRNAV